MLSNSPLSTKMTNHPPTYNYVISTSAGNEIAISGNSLSVLTSEYAMEARLKDWRL
jgi:hypothetical protein